MALILVVDDEEMVRSPVRLILTTYGYSVIEASDGQSAIELCKERDPDLVITDIVMPVMGGLELILNLKEEFPQTKIIAMSALSQSLEFAEDLGVNKTMLKPIRVQDLREVVSEVLEDQPR